MGTNSERYHLLIDQFQRNDKFPLIQEIEKVILKGLAQKLPLHFSDPFGDQYLQLSQDDLSKEDILEKILTFIDKSSILNFAKLQSKPDAYLYITIKNFILNLHNEKHPRKFLLWKKVNSLLNTSSEFRLIHKSEKNANNLFDLRKWDVKKENFIGNLEDLAKQINYAPTNHGILTKDDFPKISQENLKLMLLEIFNKAESSFNVRQIMEVLKLIIPLYDPDFFKYDSEIDENFNENFFLDRIVSKLPETNVEFDSILEKLAVEFLRKLDGKVTKIYSWYLVENYSLIDNFQGFTPEIENFLRNYRTKVKDCKISYERIAGKCGFKSDETVRSYIERNKNEDSVFQKLRKFVQVHDLSQLDFVILQKKCFIHLFKTLENNTN